MPKKTSKSSPKKPSTRLRRVMLFFGRLIRVGLFAMLIGAAFIGYANWIPNWASRGRLYDDIQAVPPTEAGLVLGTTHQIHGRENLYFRYRIDAAANLWKAGKVKRLIVSGDNRSHRYNEPEKMRTALIARGIPHDVIISDYAGLRTLDSVIRAKEVFGFPSILIISQKFHNQRAIYQALGHNINATGFNAQDVPRRIGMSTQVREIGARVLMWFDVNCLNTQPKHLGAAK